MTLGPAMYAATTDLECSFDGRFVRLLAYRPPAAPPVAVPGLWDRSVLFGPTWLVIASDVAQAREIRSVLGGRLYLTPVLLAMDWATLLGRARLSHPTGSTVRFRIGVHNPMDCSAVLACHARGLSADQTILFREQRTTTDGLRLPLGPSSRGELSGTARLLRPGGVGRIISWCVAHPAMQPADPLTAAADRRHSEARARHRVSEMRRSRLSFRQGHIHIRKRSRVSRESWSAGSANCRRRSPRYAWAARFLFPYGTAEP